MFNIFNKKSKGLPKYEGEYMKPPEYTPPLSKWINEYESKAIILVDYLSEHMIEKESEDNATFIYDCITPTHCYIKVVFCVDFNNHTIKVVMHDLGETIHIVYSFDFKIQKIHGVHIDFYKSFTDNYRKFLVFKLVKAMQSFEIMIKDQK